MYFDICRNKISFHPNKDQSCPMKEFRENELSWHCVFWKWILEEMVFGPTLIIFQVLILINILHIFNCSHLFWTVGAKAAVETNSSSVFLSRLMEPPSKKELLPLMRRPDEWKDPWRRSKSPRRRGGLGSPPRGRRRHRPSGSSVSLSNSSR